MRRPLLLLPLCLSSLSYSLATQAQPFDAEFSVLYEESSDNDLVGEGDALELRGRYYFSPVVNDRFPLHEAGFVSRSSYIGASYTDQETDARFSYFDDSSATDITQLQGRYIHAPSGWFIHASAFDGERRRAFFREELEGYSVVVGKYLAETTTVSLNYRNTDNDGEQRFIVCSIYAPCTTSSLSQDVETEGYGAFVRHLGAVSTWHYALGLSYQRENTDHSTPFSDFDLDAESYGVDATLYPDKRLSLTFSFDNRDVEGTDTDSYGVALEYFVTPWLSLSAGYREIKPDPPRVVAFGNTDSTPDISPNFDVIPAGDITGVSGFSVSVFSPPSLDREVYTLGIKTRF